MSLQTMGVNMRKLYIDKLKLVNPIIDSRHYKDIYLRSTDYARTLESLQYLLNGLYPQDKREGDIDLKVNMRSDENMYPMYDCRYLSKLTRDFRTKLMLGDAKEIDKLLSRFERFGSPDDSKHVDLRYLHSLYDTFICMDAHGVPLPPGVSQKDMLDLEQMTVKYWWNVFEQPDIARLSIGRLVKDLKDKIDDNVQNNKDSVKLAVFSGHDSTVGPLLSAFRVFDGRYPPFSCMMTLELFAEEKKKTQEHFVRVLYQGQPQKIPQCQTSGNHHSNGDTSLCTLEAFNKVMNDMIPQDYEKECESFTFS
ncbi:hypothetical protein SmJEL517_g02253 [Synchytrium microbalum]|uniref:Acid phosphatase n=1 Tax=Synchytrium microbalum TaxID=1806994 RepID=A0A507C7X8_9FUNG|nr:uncharacterized protein SmJEL517_g02253 [Synchytrium microbalum]TPX35249.1 hypothetical protein SmJEL517_g02253 [Synchytrium microbalum]